MEPRLIAIVFGAILFLLFKSGISALNSPKRKGARGEARVAAALRKLELRHQIVLTDVTVSVAAGTTQIDHILISEAGIFVIETKNMSGWIYGDADQKTWTQVHPSKKTRFQNPLRQNFGHVVAVADILGIDRRAIHNVVAFVGTAEPKTAMPENVLWSVGSLVRFFRAMPSGTLGTGEIERYRELLEQRRLVAGAATSREHVRDVSARIAARKVAGNECPRCSGQMTERQNKKTGDRFLGCSRFPQCKATRKLAA